MYVEKIPIDIICLCRAMMYIFVDKKTALLGNGQKLLFEGILYDMQNVFSSCFHADFLTDKVH